MKTLGITLGDPCGIGSEISAKALDFLIEKSYLIGLLLLEIKKSFEKSCELSGIKSNFNCIKEFIDIEANVSFDKQSSKAGGRSFI